MVLQRAKNLKGTNVFINEDFTDVVQQKKKELLPAIKAARERGDVAFLRHGRMIIHSATQQSGRSERNNIGLHGGVRETTPNRDI